MARLLQRKQAVHYLWNALIERGFVHARKTRSGSRYLRWPGCPFALRISDHPISGSALWKFPDVVKSFIPPEVPEEAIPAMAEEVKASFFRRVAMRTNQIEEVA